MPVKAVTWGSVSRITVDLDQGTYQRLEVLMQDHNERRGNRDRFLTKAGLIRGLLGSWMHQRQQPPPPQPVSSTDARWRP